jgi:flagellar secretion chaperone FliS
MAYPSGASISAYQAATVHGGVAAADPHALITLLMNGALERIVKARSCIVNKSLVEKAGLIHRSVSIIDQLRNSLNLESGADVAANLDRLYDYMCRQLLKATVENNIAPLDEVTKLLTQIRDAWTQMPQGGAHK